MWRGGRTPSSRWLPWLLLCIFAQSQLARAQAAISTLFVPDTNTVIAVNLPPDSDDINFYVLTPDWYQYSAIGFGTTMSDALMLVMYASEDRRGVTVSPRVATGHSEPVWTPDVQVTVHEAIINSNFDMVVNATCNRCRPSVRVDSASPMMFAVGPALELSSDDLDARLRRHTAYGHFTADLIRATGPGGIPVGVVGPSTNASSGAALVRDGDDARGVRRDRGSRAAAAHGIMYAIVTLAIAPFDALVAGVLGSRWAWLHGATASLYFVLVMGALVPGVLVSREHVATQQFRTGHQVIGLLTVVAIGLMYAWGFALSWIKRSAKKRGQEPPESTRRLGAIHRWACRLIWVLLLVNVGLGLHLSKQRLVLILAYLALALGVIIVLVPIYFCIWRFSRRKKRKEEGAHEMHTIYDHNYRYD